MAGKRACYLGVVIVGAIAVASSQTFDPSRQFGMYGPSFVPLLLGAALVILGILGLLRPGPVPRAEVDYDVRKLAIAVAAMAAYVLVFRSIGFFLDTIAIAVALALILVREHKVISVFGVAGFVALIYVLMHNVMEVQFPNPQWLSSGLL